MKEKPQISHEIKILEERLAQLRAVLQKPEALNTPEASINAVEKELVAEAVKDRIREGMLLPPSPIPPAPPAKLNATISQRQNDDDKTIEPFVAIAFSQNIPSAVRAVMKSGNAHLIDALHDVLVDRFYEEMIKLGKLKSK